MGAFSREPGGHKKEGQTEREIERDELKRGVQRSVSQREAAAPGQ